MEQIDFSKIVIDYDPLPEDCIAATAERMRRSYSQRRCYDARMFLLFLETKQLELALVL